MGIRLLHRLQPFFVLLALALMLLLLQSQWEELQSHRWQLDPLWFAVAAGATVAAWSIEILLWQQLLQLVGGRLPWGTAARIWFLSAIVRYLPGNIWQPLSITLLAQRHQVRPEATLASVALYQVITLLAVAPIAALYFALTRNWGLLNDFLQEGTPWLAGLALLPLLALIAQPNWLLELLNWLLHRLGRAPLSVRLGRASVLALVTVAMVDWVVWGGAFAALAFAVSSYSVHELWALTPHLVALYCVAYAVGFASLLTPSGLGMREGALYLLLAPLLGGGTTTLLALAMRIWTVVAELIAASVSAVVGMRSQALAPASLPAAETDLKEGIS